jgi:hypothetical protein
MRSRELRNMMQHSCEVYSSGVPRCSSRFRHMMKMQADHRNRKRQKGQGKWNPKLHDAVLVKCQHASDATQGVIGKFQRPYEGP